MSVDAQHHDPNAIPEQEAHPYHLPPPPGIPPDPLAPTKDELIERQPEQQPLPQNESYQPIDDPLAPPPPPHLEPIQQQQPPHLMHHHHHHHHPEQLIDVPPDHAPPPPPPPPPIHVDPVHGAVPTHHQDQQQQLVSVPHDTAPPPHSVHGAPSPHVPEPQPQVQGHTQPPDPLEQPQHHQNQPQQQTPQQQDPQQHHQNIQQHQQQHHEQHQQHQPHELVAIPPNHPPPTMHAPPPVHGAPAHAAPPPAPPQVQTQPQGHAQQHMVIQHPMAYQPAPPPPSNHPLPAPPPVHLTTGMHMLPVPPPLAGPGPTPHQQQQPTANTLHHSHSEPQAAELPQPQEQQPGPPPTKKQRRRYDNNFKAEVLDHLKMPGTKLPAVAKQYGIPENTLREWTKVTVVQSIEAARAKHGGTLKANMYDPMNKLTARLMEFFEKNEMEPHNTKQPVTTKLVVRKGLEARDAILAEHQRNPSTLDAKERKALESFTGSDSWAKKFAKRHDLKMTGARVKELMEEDVRNFTSQLRTMANRVKQAGPGYDEVTSLLRQAADKLVSARIVVARGSRHPATTAAIAAAKQGIVEHQQPHPYNHHHQQQQQQTHQQQTHHAIIGEI